MPKPTKWFPKKIQEHYTTEISKFELGRAQLTEEESNTLAEALTAHYEEQMKLPKEQREVYFDGGKNHYCLLFMSKPPAEPPKKVNPNTNKEEYSFSCRFLKGSVWVSFPIHLLEKVLEKTKKNWNVNIWVRGKYTERINIMGFPQGKYETLEEAVDANTTDEKPILIENLTESDIARSYFLSIYNVVSWEER